MATKENFAKPDVDVSVEHQGDKRTNYRWVIVGILFFIVVNNNKITYLLAAFKQLNCV